MSAITQDKVDALYQDLRVAIHDATFANDNFDNARLAVDMAKDDKSMAVAQRKMRSAERNAHIAKNKVRRIERLIFVAKSKLQEQRDEESWFEKARANVLLERRRRNAAVQIQRAWRKYSSDPSNAVGFERMANLWIECLNDPIE